MTIHNYDNNGRPVVKLGWTDRTVIGAISCILVAAVCWMGNELVSMRDSLKAQAINQSYDHAELVDHEGRIREQERRHP